MPHRGIIWNFDGSMDLFKKMDPVLEGIIEILHKEKRRQIVVTNKSADVTSAYLELNDVHDVIAHIQERGALKEQAHFKKFVQLFDLIPRDTYFVSDKPEDMHAACSLGMIPVAITWGASSLRKLENAKPAYVAQKPEALIPILLGRYEHRKGI